MTPAVGGAAYPTGTVTLTDALTAAPPQSRCPADTDTISVPLTGLAPGTHTFTATYSGDSNYTLTAGQTAYSTTAPYSITVNAGSLGSNDDHSLRRAGTVSFGTSFTATATVAGSSPTGTVEFVVNGSVFATRGSQLGIGVGHDQLALQHQRVQHLRGLQRRRRQRWLDVGYFLRHGDACADHHIALGQHDAHDAGPSGGVDGNG